MRAPLAREEVGTKSSLAHARDTHAYICVYSVEFTSQLSAGYISRCLSEGNERD